MATTQLIEHVELFDQLHEASERYRELPLAKKLGLIEQLYEQASKAGAKEIASERCLSSMPLEDFVKALAAAAKGMA
ncbi:hypothetical protein [Azotobacter beijerinckii]|uniref:Uncharacterized protein n=1 Tax=Azotobacter beijerinckii TaxID=170623 RepID=A0A1I4I4H5_9GAMM|nr:hypothetical protein [Azotobacter beijerinckii]SFB63697.1 hypothetical protein SAMN04244571_04573 [Azotobacter beijerinckii]SFL48893.1 hypothetical protein SAMN04244574_04465 [Azotobacter beijerinckii]